MTAPDTHVGFALTLPELFQPVPARASSEFDTWRKRVSAVRPVGWGVGEASIERDLDGLTTAMETESSQAKWFVAVAEAPYQHGLSAVGWVRVDPAGETTAENLNTCFETVRAANIESVVSASTTLHDLGDRTAVICHQFRPARHLGREIATSRLIERCAGLMLDAASDVLVRVDFTAFDLRTFHDAVQTTLEVLASVRIEGGPL